MAIAEVLENVDGAFSKIEDLGFVVEKLETVLGNVSLCDSTTVLWVELNTPVNQRLLDSFPNLKFVVSPTTGITHIDLEIINAKSIKLISLQGEIDFLKSITSTSEFAWALMLAVWRKLGLALNPQQNLERSDLVTAQIQGKSIGIIGLGRIGKRVAKYAEAFEMQIFAFDPYLSTNEVPTSVIILEQLDELLRLSDVVLIASSVVESDIPSYPLLSTAEFSSMKQGSILINISRGVLLDECALVPFLISGHIAGLGLDVYRSEDLIYSGPNCERELRLLINQGFNVILTKHLGGASKDAYSKVVEFIVNKLYLHLQKY